MARLALTAAAIIPLIAAPALPAETDQAKVEILRADPRFDEVVPPGAAFEKVLDGFTWTEGPVWNEREGALYFSDIPANAVYRWRPGDKPEIFLTPSGYTGTAPFTGREPGSNGLLFDREGRLVLCEHGDRRIGRIEKDGRHVTLADRYEGKRLNSPNDVVQRANGDLYFTDPPFGLPGTFTDPARELDYAGVYRLTPDGELTLLTKELTHPNGIAFDPAEKILYVSDAVPERPRYLAYPLKEDGTLGPARLVYDATSWVSRWPGTADGIEVDRNGNLFAAGPGGIHVFSPEGVHLGSFIAGTATSNSAWADHGRLLYVTAGTGLYRIRPRIE